MLLRGRRWRLLKHPPPNTTRSGEDTSDTTCGEADEGVRGAWRGMACVRWG